MRNVFVVLMLVSLNLSGQVYPFPNHTNYKGIHLKPSLYTQSQLDVQTQTFYDEWKTEYLKNDCGNSDNYYVFVGNGVKNLSEAQGYGMMIIAYFAGYDTNAQAYFDGLYRFCKLHPSNINGNLMDWKQVTCNDSLTSDDDAASDGDIDIAFALLLAHSQWGSNGDINYMAEAHKIIDAIMLDEINQNTWTVKLGDWCNANDSLYFYGTRTSDFIIDHFRVFMRFNKNWNNVIDTCYFLIENIQNNYSPTTGLIPDFIVNVNTNPEPAEKNYLEDTTDGYYAYNACRVPWRLGTDYLINATNKAQQIINKINKWLLKLTNGNVDSISNGYELNGKPLYDWNDATFIGGPFAVAAMADVSNPSWLNNLYEELLNNNIADGDYYSNTIKLLSMLTISENYWVPDCDDLGVNEFNFNEDNIIIYPNSTKGLINIKVENQPQKDNLSGKIIDIQGKVLMSNIIIKDNKRLDISFLETGIYFISIESNKTKITKKIIKE